MPEPLYVPAGARLKPEYRIGLVGHWKMNTNAGVLCPDLSDSNPKNDGTLTNMDNPPTATSGWGGQWLIFDGVDDDVLLNSTDYLAFSGNVDYTISGWLKTSTAAYPTGNSAFAGKWGGSSRGYMIYFGAFGSIRLYTNASSCDSAYYTSYRPDGRWHHLVGIKSGSVGKVYIDGVPLIMDVSTFIDNTITNEATTKFEIGSYNSNSGANFPGFIDDVRVYNRALSADEVAHSYLQQEDEWDLGLDDDIDIMQGIPQKMNAYKQMRA